MYDVPWGKTKADPKYPFKVMGEMKVIPAKHYFSRPPFEGPGAIRLSQLRIRPAVSRHGHRQTFGEQNSAQLLTKLTFKPHSVKRGNCFESFKFWSFGFVSDFGFRISNLV